MDNMRQFMDQKGTQSQRQTQRLIMLPQMQQAIHTLQVPVLELAAMVQAEMEQNPIIEYADQRAEDYEREDPLYEAPDHFQEQDAPEDQEVTISDEDFEVLKQLDEEYRDHFMESENYSIRRTQEEEKRQTFLESIITQSESLYEHLMRQAREAYTTSREIELAELLIGNLDDSGLMTSSLEELAVLNHLEVEELKAVLKQLQTFHPPGIAAVSVREALLVQLRRQNKQDSLAYQIIDQHYEDLLHNRVPQIAKSLGFTAREVTEAVQQQISRLDLHPGAGFGESAPQTIVPDATLRKEGEVLQVETNNDPVPHFRINRKYLRMLEDPSLNEETKTFIKQKIASAQWLMRNIDQRHDTVTRIAQSLARRQRAFFLSPDGQLVPLTMKEIAEELELHESTIARAVSNKYLQSPRGLLPLRSFFTNALETSRGESISSSSVRDALERLIDKEDKKKPLSDQLLSQMLKKQGIRCARRTVAKYRDELGIGNTQQRRVYH